MIKLPQKIVSKDNTKNITNTKKNIIKMISKEKYF